VAHQLLFPLLYLVAALTSRLTSIPGVVCWCCQHAFQSCSHSLSCKCDLAAAVSPPGWFHRRVCG
jgi:hypothetical protein